MTDSPKTTDADDEQPGFEYHECRVCGYSMVTEFEGGVFYGCPQCGEDTGSAETMDSRTARVSDNPQGADARKEE